MPIKMDVLPAALFFRASSGEYAIAAMSGAASTASLTPASISKAYLVAASVAIVPGVNNAKKEASTPPRANFGKST